MEELVGPLLQTIVKELAPHALVIFGVVVLGKRLKGMFPEHHRLHHAWPFVASLLYAIAYNWAAGVEGKLFLAAALKVWLGVGTAAIVLYDKFFKGGN